MTGTRKIVHWRSVVFVVVTLLAPAMQAKASSYEFKVVRASIVASIQTIELIDTLTGQPEPNATIEVVHTRGRHRTFVSLQDHLSGKCAHPQSDSSVGGELTLMAKVPGRFWPVWGTVDLGN